MSFRLFVSATLLFPLLLCGRGIAQAQTPPATPASTLAQTQNTEYVVPKLGVDIPGVTLTAPTDGEGGLSIPFLMEYVNGAYRFAITLGMLAAIIVIMWGGFLYLVGSTIGDVEKGKKKIIDALAGFAILLAATAILGTINPMTTRLAGITLPPVSTERAEDYDSQYDDTTGRVGPRSFCRENLRRDHGNIWCAACNVACEMRPNRPDTMCQSVIAGTPPCGGSFALFLKAQTDSCQSKRLYWLDGLDGITFGILHYTANNIPSLMQKFQTMDPTAYTAAMGNYADHAKDRDWLCTQQREQRGAICDEGFRQAMERALATPSFAKVQLEDTFRSYTTRIAAGSAHFRSEYGQLMWAVAMNNPGRCGADFAPIMAVCSGSASENDKIECFLNQFVAQGCRGSVAGARSRADSIRLNLATASKTVPPSPITIDTIKACVH